MSKPGPAPTPTHLKKLAGNPGRRPLNGSEAQFPIPSRMPPVPESLQHDAEAVKCWQRMGKMLLEAGLLSSADLIGLEMLCMAYGRWLTAEKKCRRGQVKMSDKGNLYQNPWVSIASRAWEQVYKMLAQFGLTPAERSRVSAFIREDEQEIGDMLAEEFFEGVEVKGNAGAS